jgi:hypothetical protein
MMLETKWVKVKGREEAKYKGRLNKPKPNKPMPMIGPAKFMTISKKTVPTAESKTTSFQEGFLILPYKPAKAPGTAAPTA